MAQALSPMEQYSDLQKEIILLVHIDYIPVEDTLKLQKMVFFFSNKVEKIKEHGFKPSIYGPHSELVDRELQSMIQQEILSMDGEKISTTLKGKDIFKNIIKDISINIVTKRSTWVNPSNIDVESYFRFVLSGWKDIVNDLTRDELLSFIYCDLPDMIADRTEYERLKPHFEEHIISMIKKEKITAARGAGFLNKPINYMIDKGLVELSDETYPSDLKI